LSLLAHTCDCRHPHSFPTRRSSDLGFDLGGVDVLTAGDEHVLEPVDDEEEPILVEVADVTGVEPAAGGERGRGGRLIVPVGAHEDRKSTRLNSSHVSISYAVFCLKK